jgi:nucleotide-binding universal stress UspA family protein
MKKILFVCDGDHFPVGAFKFIKLLQAVEPVTLKGMFFTEIALQQLTSVSYIPFVEPFIRLKEEEKKTIIQSRERFIRQCKSYGIRYQTEENDGGWNKDLFAKETRFADLAVISEQLFCKDMLEDQPNSFMQEALRTAECPVMIIPETFSSIEHIVVAHDGKKESAFALKQFSNLFSQYDELPIEFVYVKDEESDAIPDMELLKEYSNAHFDAGNITKLHFRADKSFSKWLQDKKDTLLVSGSFSRSGASLLFSPSFAEQIIKKSSIPVFIAHNV